MLVRFGFEETLYPFKCKIPAKFYPFKDKSPAHTFLYHANRGGQNSWADKASHVRDFPVQASEAWPHFNTNFLQERHGRDYRLARLPNRLGKTMAPPKNSEWRDACQIKSAAVRNWFLSIASGLPQDALCAVGFRRNPNP